MTIINLSIPILLLGCGDAGAFAVRLGADADIPEGLRCGWIEAIAIASPAATARPGALVLVEFQPEARRPPALRRWPVDEPEAMRVSMVLAWWAVTDAGRLAEERQAAALRSAGEQVNSSTKR